MTWAGGWGEALRAAVSSPFSAASGIGVEHHTHVGLRLPGVLEDALRRGAPPPFDVVWSNSGPAIRMARAGLTEPLDGIDALRELHRRAAPERCGERARGEWPLVYTYVVFYVLVYRKELYPDVPPASWEILCDPRHRGRVALYPGGNGLYPVAQRMGGGAVSDIPREMGPCWEFVRRLRGQVGRLDYSIGMGRLIGTKQLDLCFRALTNALAFRAEGLDVDFATPSEGVADTLDCMWIPAGLTPDRIEAARLYVAHALSARVQSEWCARLGALPTNALAEVPKLCLEHPGLPNDACSLDGVLHLSESLKADFQASWEERFEREIS